LYGQQILVQLCLKDAGNLFNETHTKQHIPEFQIQHRIVFCLIFKKNYS